MTILDHSLFNISRQVRNESIKILYGEHVFIFTNLAEYHDQLQRTYNFRQLSVRHPGRTCLNMIQHLGIDFIYRNKGDRYYLDLMDQYFHDCQFRSLRLRETAPNLIYAHYSKMKALTRIKVSDFVKIVVLSELSEYGRATWQRFVNEVLEEKGWLHCDEPQTVELAYSGAPALEWHLRP